MRSPNKSRSRNKSRRNNNNNSAANMVNRVFDSSGPDGRVRGTPNQIIEKYEAHARDSVLSGDRVMAENFQQHSEHYIRILAEAKVELEKAQAARQAEEDARRKEREEREEKQRAEAPKAESSNETSEAADADNEVFEVKPKRTRAPRKPKETAFENAEDVPDFLKSTGDTA